MPELQDETPSSSGLAAELADCRQRGIEGLDRDSHNQHPVPAAHLERLAQVYSSVTGIVLYGRIQQIKYLLRRALESYSQNGNEGDARLISDLFFGDAVDSVRRSAGELLDLARRKWGDTESRFRERRVAAFRAFAAFLIQFVAAAESQPDAAGQQRAATLDRGWPGTYGRPSDDGRTWSSSPLEAVLRFSLDDPGGTGRLTIEEHQQIIAQEGSCWWGWFRAAHDSDHSASIAQRLGNSSCEIALWERSEGLCYVARCEEAVVGRGADVPSPQPNLTPAYYRSKSLRAWLRLTAISKAEDRDEIAERFGDIPTAKATIYWSPEPAREPIVIPAQGRAILHLAGLRFGRNHRWSTSLASRGRMTTEEAVTEVLAQHDIDIDTIGMVIICGNIVSDIPTESAFQEALAFVDGLCEQLPSVQRDHIVAVPGADDFARPGDRERKSQALYREFHRQLYGGPEQDMTHLRRYEFPGFRVNVLPANSVKMLGEGERDEGFFGQGYDSQLRTMRQDYLRAQKAGERVINVVAAHHHLIPTLVKLPERAAQASVRERLLPGIHDARDLLVKLAAGRVRLFLHGHLHQPDLIYISSDDGWQTAVCSSGTVGAADWWLRTKYRTNHDNAIALYDVEDAAISARMFAFSEDFSRPGPAKHFRMADHPTRIAE